MLLFVQYWNRSTITRNPRPANFPYLESSKSLHPITYHSAWVWPVRVDDLSNLVSHCVFFASSTVVGKMECLLWLATWFNSSWWCRRRSECSSYISCHNSACIFTISYLWCSMRNKCMDTRLSMSSWWWSISTSSSSVLLDHDFVAEGVGDTTPLVSSTISLAIVDCMLVCNYGSELW